MARLFTPYRSLLSEADMEDTGGLLATPRSAPTPVATNPLAEQIRTLYGNRGDWNYGGIDRAAELADLLQKQGITDVSKIALQKGTRQEQQFSGGEDGQMNTVDLPANQVLFGDKRIGFAGDYNNDNTYGTNAGSYLQGDNTLGWSARGHGNVTYKVGTDAQGNNYLMPEWGSSSDMKDVRDAAKAAAVIAAMAYGVPMLGAEAAPALTGVDAAMADLAASGGLTGSSLGAVAAPAAASTVPLTPAAMESLMATPGYGVNAAAQTAAVNAGMNSALVGSAATAPFESIGFSGVADPTYANETSKLLRQQTIAETTPGGGLANMSGSAATVPTLNVNKPGSLLDAIQSGDAIQYLKDNKELARLLFAGGGALLSAAGGSNGKSGGGYVDSGYRPTISRGGFNAAPQARQMAPTMGLLNTPTTGQPMSGLWRYGLLGG